METKFIKADRWNCRTDLKNEDKVDLRLISEEAIMHTTLNIDEMKRLRDFLNGQIERYETQKGVED